MDVADGVGTWEAAITPATRMIYVETPTNPGLDIADLDALDQLAAARSVLLVVDNRMCSPVLQQPLRHGAHISVHSATKFIDGQGREMWGVVIGRQDLIDQIYTFRRSTGSALSPFNAWVLSNGPETDLA